MKNKVETIVLLLIALALWMYANYREVQNGYFPDQDQTQEEALTGYHSQQGETRIQDGLLIIDKD